MRRLKLRGRISVHTSSTYLRQSDSVPSVPVERQPCGIAFSRGQSEYCSSSLTTTTYCRSTSMVLLLVLSIITDAELLERMHVKGCKINRWFVRHVSPSMQSDRRRLQTPCIFQHLVRATCAFKEFFSRLTCHCAAIDCSNVLRSSIYTGEQLDTSRRSAHCRRTLVFTFSGQQCAEASGF